MNYKLQNKTKILISFCVLLIILNLINCMFFDNSKLACTLNIIAMVFVIIVLIYIKKDS
jgi:hypothetical protein